MEEATHDCPSPSDWCSTQDLTSWRINDPKKAPPSVRIVHSGHACTVEEERYSERVYTIREGETLELVCLVSGHPRPQSTFTTHGKGILTVLAGVTGVY
ncbi:hypothetical protein NFI96_008258 [Prochilodus magdalenae]|nr:hypothetical protein NFI96_008258 [Prochilodus magdalenae]